jgi:hypothetical protein
MFGGSKTKDLDKEVAMGLRWTFMPVNWRAIEPDGPVQTPHPDRGQEKHLARLGIRLILTPGRELSPPRLDGRSGHSSRLLPVPQRRAR